MIRIYRRDGKPYEGSYAIEEWCKDFEDPSLKFVARDQLQNGILVSTVWLGLDHSHFGGRPKIFETVLLIHDLQQIGETWRYSTEEEAIRGHKMQVKKWSKFKSIDQIMSIEKK